MENSREYRIIINGIEESVSAVDELVKKLEQLEEKINNLSATTVNVKVEGDIKTDTSTDTSSSRSRTEDLSADERVYEQILNAEKKLEEARSREYEDLLQKKQLIKETRKERQAEAAEERLAADAYEKTLDGQRQKLSDLKRVIGNWNVEFQGQEKFDELVNKTKQLNDEIKAAEKSYGTFGRNVGNYAEGVAEGIESAQKNMSSFKVVVNGVTREYASAREASRDLNNELKTMAINGQQGTQEFKNLRETVLQLESAMNDAKMSSQWMDDLLDTMQSFTALGSVTQGFSSLFGFDSSAVEEQIRKLVALQNVLQGIEKLQKQMQTNEGLGKVFRETSKSVDQFTAKITGSQIKMGGLVSSSRSATIAVRALSTALKGVYGALAALAVYLGGKAFDEIKKFVKGNADMVNVENLATTSVEAHTNAIKRMTDELKKSYDSGEISYWQFKTRTIQNATNALDDYINRSREAMSNEGSNTFSRTSRGENITIDETWFDGFDVATDNIEKVREAYTDLKNAVEKGVDINTFKNGEENNPLNANFWRQLATTVGDAKDDLSSTMGAIAGNYVNQIQKINLNTVEGRKEFERLAKQLNDDEITHSVFFNLDQWVKTDKARAEIEAFRNEVLRTQEQLNNFSVDNFNSKVNGIIESTNPTERLRRQKKELEDMYNDLGETITTEQLANYQKAQAQLDKQIAEIGKRERDKRRQEAKKTLDEQRSIYNNLSSLEIRLMNDGLRKKIAQLELNRRREIETLKGTAKQVAEQTRLINQYYDNEVFNAKKEHFDNLVELQRRYNDEIAQLQKENIQNSAENEITKNEIERNKAVRGLTTVPTHETTNAAGTATGFSINTSELEETIKANRKLVNDLHEQIVSVVEDDKRLLDDVYSFGKEEKKIIESSISIEEINRRFKERYDARLEYYNKVNELDKENAKKEYEIEKEKLKEIYKLEKEQRDKEEKLRIGSNDDFGMFGDEEGVDIASVSNKFSSYDVRKKAYEKSLKEYKKLRAEGKATQEELDARAAELNETDQNLKGELKELEAAYEQYYQIQEALLAENLNKYEQGLISKKEMTEAEEMFVSRVGGELAKDYRKGNIDFEKFANTRNSLSQEYFNRSENLYHKYENDIKKLDENKNKEEAEREERKYDLLIQEFDNYYSTLQNRISNQPVLDSFGIVNLKQTRKNYKELLKGFDEVKNNIINAKKEIERQFAEGLIDRETYDRIVAQLDSLGNSANEAAKTVKKQSIDLVSDFVSSINYWLNAVGQSFEQVMSEWYSYQDFLLEDEANMIDKQNEILDKKLQEQEDIIDKHKNNIDSIEDEIQTARGDRREHLIDMLNAEIAAQREAVAEQKRMQKEQEANEKRLEEIEYQRSVQQWQQSLNQALISNSLAIMNALATSPFVPNGLAMAALATTAGGVQIALIKKQKPKKYSEGGLLEGKSHAQGGIKVGNNVELEGHEYVTNKITTMRNIELLEFINSKKKKVDLNDLIEFYSDNSSRKKVNLTGKFADGGTLPTIDISRNNNTIVVKDDSQYVVQVVDIIKETDKVKRIEALAGL